jgi:four helix bundle protein
MPDSYRSLVAWKRGMDLVHAVYLATARFPDSEKFALADQMRRAGVSVVSNIAEGYGRYSRTDCRRYLRTARGSLYELETQILIAARLGFLTQNTVRDIFDIHEEVGRTLQGLIRHLDSKT